MTTLLLIGILLINGLFLWRFISDALKNKALLAREPGNPVGLGLGLGSIFFCSALGMSDFALSTVLYRKMRWVEDKLLPGTLNAQSVIPVSTMALAFIQDVKVDFLTLGLCILSQVIGAYFGPRLVVKLSAKAIRLCIGAGLVAATLFILAGKLHLVPVGGTAMGLSGTKLMIACMAMFSFGALNNIGIGCFAPTMVTIYALGMNPAAAFPIMMGASAFSVPVGSMQFIRYGSYSRKITLAAVTAGVIGALIGVKCFSLLDLSALQWLVAAILLYTGSSMLLQEWKANRLSLTTATSAA